MNVNELRNLALWFEREGPEIIELYNALLDPVQHNAAQPNKRPLEDQLNTVIEHLNNMSFQELSLEQIAILEQRGVSDYLGRDGAYFVEQTIRVSDYDAATAAARLQEAVADLNQTLKVLKAYSHALNAIGIEEQDFEPEENSITIRIGFRRGASIDNVVAWKDSARDWYDIVRGLAMAVGEPPENTRVVGATSGSIILWLVATAGVTLLLARISKHITGIAKDIISVELAREELRQKKILTKGIESELEKQIEEKKLNAKNLVIEEIKKNIPNLDGEKENAIVKSVQKLLAFSKAGGDVDFVAPTDDEIDEESDEGEKVSYLAEAREAIRAYQAARDEIRLLTDGRASDNEA